jgi:hypothetical protein
VPGELLPGGFVTPVVRAGDTVVRRPGPDSEFVHRLLELLAQSRWPGAPRYLGTDEDGREILEFLDGHVGWQAAQPASVSSDESLAAAASLMRQFHDLTAGSVLAAGAETVCHNDLSPRNTVYRDAGHGLRPAAFIDWDIAAPGRRIHDVAHACWQFVGLGPQVSDVAEAARRVRVICDGYRLTDRGELVETILWWQDRCWRGIEAQAEAGDAAMIRLRDSGAAADVRAQHDWVARHRRGLEHALRQDPSRPGMWGTGSDRTRHPDDRGG